MTHEWSARARNRRAIASRRVILSAPCASGRPIASSAASPSSSPSRDELPPEAAAERELFRALGYEAARRAAAQDRNRARDGRLRRLHARRAVHWTPEVLATLRLTAEILANALDRKRNDGALRERLAFEEALSAIATRFISASVDAIDGAIEEALRVIGQTLRYERTAVFLLDDRQEHMALAYEWCAPGVRSFRASMSGLRSRSSAGRSTEIAAGKVVNIDRRTRCPTARCRAARARPRRLRHAVDGADAHRRARSSAASASTRAPGARSARRSWRACVWWATSSPARSRASARSWRGAARSPSWRS